MFRFCVGLNPFHHNITPFIYMHILGGNYQRREKWHIQYFGDEKSPGDNTIKRRCAK